jgi:enoyl-CoA hydratase/crotonobetainyl-CoA hydratase
MSAELPTPPEAGIVREVRDHVGLIIISRPAVRNAVDRATAFEIADAVDSFEADRAVLAIVIAGSGGFFCAGMDLKALAATGQGPVTPTRGAFGIVEKPPAKPFIAAVEGAALGGGLEIALAADLVVVADDAKLGLPEVARGLIAAAGGVFRLPNRIPRALALEMMLTGKPITAQRAYDIGLVNDVVPAGKALTRAVEVANEIAANAPIALRASKAIALRSTHWRDEEAFALQRPLADVVRESADAAEGAKAFIEKRSPVWRDC